MEVPGVVLKQLLRKEIPVELDEVEEALAEPSIALTGCKVRRTNVSRTAKIYQEKIIIILKELLTWVRRFLVSQET